MPASLPDVLDRHFGVHAQALKFRAARSRIIASNLANADTPGYLARDVDFAQVLTSQQTRTPQGSGPIAPTVRLATTHPGHLHTNRHATSTGALLYRNPYQPTLDGNTVEAEVEQANFARNAVQYQASLTFLSGKIRGLRHALTGGQ